MVGVVKGGRWCTPQDINGQLGVIPLNPMVVRHYAVFNAGNGHELCSEALHDAYGREQHKHAQQLASALQQRSAVVPTQHAGRVNAIGFARIKAEKHSETAIAQSPPQYA